MLQKFSGVESYRTVSKLRRENFCAVFTYSIKWAHEIREIHVSRATTAKKCIKSLLTCKVVVLLIKPTAFLTFSLLLLSLLLKFPIVVIQKFCCHDVKVMSHFSSLRSLNGVSGYSHSFFFFKQFLLN